MQLITQQYLFEKQYPFCFCLPKSQTDWWEELFMEPAELPIILDNPFSEMDSKEHSL